jgi:hypothetical protein
MYQRRGTATQWANVANSVILQAGEIGLETDTGKFKIGNGQSLWSALSYYLKDSDNSSLYVKLNPIAPGYNQTITGINLFVPQSPSQTPLVVGGVSGQSAVLQRWRNSTDDTLASIDQAGKLTATGALFNAEVNVNNNKIVNIALPTEPKDAANKEYVDEIAQGLSVKPAVQAATTENLVGTYANGTSGVGATLNIGPAIELDIDGWTTWALEDGVLVKDQTNKAHNGRYYIYQVGDVDTDWILIRCTACDEQDEIPSAYVFVQHGDTYANTGWVAAVEDLATFEVGVDDITWVQFSGAGTFTAGDGLILDGPEFNVVGTANRITANADSIDIASTYVGQTSITTLGTVTTGTWSASTIAADKGGTGQTSYAVGDILFADTTATLAKRSAGTVSYPLLSGGAGVAPNYGQIVTASIADSSSTTTGVTYAKLQYLSAQYRILGRISSGAGIAQELTPDNIITVIGQGTTTISFNRLPVSTSGGNNGTASTLARSDHTHTIGQLSDVVITGTPVVRQVIKYNGTSWVNEVPSGGISVGATPPSQPAAGDAWFDSNDGSLYVYYDDGVGTLTTRTNLVTNPSFETNITGWLGFLDTPEQSSTYSFVGTKSLKMNPVESGDYVRFSNIPVTAGEVYTVSAYIYTDTSKSVNIAVTGDDSTVTIPAGVWTRISASSTIPEFTTTADVFITSFSDDTIPFYIDAVMLEQSSTLNQYFDGSTAGASWTGTAHASTSTLSVSSGNSAQWVQVKANSALEASILTRMSAVEAQLVQNSNNQYSVNATKYASYILTAEDQNSFIPFDTASAGGSVTVSIPTDATYNFDIGTKIDIGFINGINKLLISAQTPGTTTIHNKLASLQSVSVVAYGMATLVKVAANKWMITGDIASPTP